MCRIAGFWDFNTTSSYDAVATILAMRDSMAYGGPDDAGIYEGPHRNMFFGHRRLSVLDLSEAGHQPMMFDGMAITYNGEVYNFRGIRKELLALGYHFHSDSDTEVVLKAFHKWGPASLEKFRGMFAFAIWDEKQEKLHLCRDRVGVKPLYWHFHAGLFMFSSELKSFDCHPRFSPSIDRSAVSLFLQWGYIPAPRSIFQHTHKVMPGTILTIDAAGRVETQRYWNIEQTLSSPAKGPDEETIATELEELLLESFRLRLVSDVPVGIFLSGGIDSSLVAALLQKSSGQPLKTFTIGFREPAFDEAPQARRLADYLGTEHTEYYCTENDFLEILDSLPLFFDEPFGDSSSIPTYIVSRLARDKVTVSLSADGGDEIFGGYPKYQAAEVYSRLGNFPFALKRLASGLAHLLLQATLLEVPFLSRHMRNHRGIQDKLHKISRSATAETVIAFFLELGKYVSRNELESLTGQSAAEQENGIRSLPIGLISLLGLTDLTTYVADDLMVKVDRATMQVALEGREPFLDHRIIEFGMTLEDKLKLKNGQTKYILRKILRRHVPENLIKGRKQGFGIPVDRWLRTTLHHELIAMTEDREFHDTFEFNTKCLRSYVNGYLANSSYMNSHFIWFLYVLYRWHNTWVQHGTLRAA